MLPLKSYFSPQRQLIALVSTLLSIDLNFSEKYSSSFSDCNDAYFFAISEKKRRANAGNRGQKLCCDEPQRSCLGLYRPQKCGELLNPTRETFMIASQSQPGELPPAVVACYLTNSPKNGATTIEFSD